MEVDQSIPEEQSPHEEESSSPEPTQQLQSSDSPANPTQELPSSEHEAQPLSAEPAEELPSSVVDGVLASGWTVHTDGSFTDGDPLDEGNTVHLCPYRAFCSKSTIVDESEEFPEPVGPLQHLVDVEQPKPKRSFAQLYLAECRKYGITPLTYIREIFEQVDAKTAESVEIDLNRFGCSNLKTQIILDCLAQACPDRLKLIKLDHNLLMNLPLAVSLSNLLQETQKISELSLAHCRLSDDEVALTLAEALSTSSVQRLNLTRCQLSDRAGVALFRALTLSDCIQRVDVSWNRLEHSSGVAAGLFLSGNSAVQELNLEGNYLYLEKQCIVPFMQELAKNVTLKKLNLAWNALGGKFFAETIYKAFVKTGLEVVNLEMNCLRSIEMENLLRVLRKSDLLKEIYLGGNFFTVDELKELVTTFGENPNMKILSLGKYQFVNRVTNRLSKRIMTQDPSKTITYQGVLLPKLPLKVDIPEMLLDRCRFLGLKPKKKKLKRNLGHLMLQFQLLEKPSLPRDDFLAMVKKFRIKLDKDLKKILMETFADQKRVDTAAMAAKYLEKYPTEPPPVKKKKDRSGKKKEGKKGGGKKKF
ncbi:leucine-rich repeat-containing protein 74A-like [Topomyia yanbarensis]|uniref:leucine-rich repeat-containing protein 74A-like n=1 Tax=Topomyia yanbarensis TaxID=2498891 RepID=UPI00273BC6C4|nr:leucine-rich repeat-containing protein 74A-like [Topomyia yanbarensis]XP_058812990.1 leucine-rich repeat-containing protein 74A-like [Topomyia yanbarensis]